METTFSLLLNKEQRLSLVSIKTNGCPPKFGRPLQKQPLRIRNGFVAADLSRVLRDRSGIFLKLIRYLTKPTIPHEVRMGDSRQMSARVAPLIL
jgi:hypothetical protein